MDDQSFIEQAQHQEPYHDDDSNYASGLKRFIAGAIDTLTIGAIVSWVGVIISIVLSILYFRTHVELTQKFWLANWFIVGIAYFVYFESSKWKATIGKRLMGICVTDINGERLSYQKAFSRTCSKVLSFLCLGIGFFMIPFAKNKQGLHDRIAQTFVIKNQDEKILAPIEENQEGILASFNKRALAWFIDCHLLVLCGFIFWLLLFLTMPTKEFVLLTIVIGKKTVTVLFMVFYSIVSALFESSKYQATPGKILTEIYVTDENNQKLSFGRALGRNLTKIICLSNIFYYILLGIEILLVIFSSKKQGLHDLIAKTKVMEK